MLTKNKNPKISYASRLLVLPLAALVFFAFAIKMKTISSINNYTGKKITVAIASGHGGDDKRISANNNNEKNLTLSMAKENKEFNKNDMNISTMQDTTPVSKMQFFVRLEGNAVLNDKINKVTAKADTIIIQSIDKKNNLNMYGEASKIELSTKTSSVTDPIYYVDGKEISKNEMKNVSINNLEFVSILKGESAVKKYGEKGKNGVIEIITKNKIADSTIKKPVYSNSIPSVSNIDTSKIIIMINGKIQDKEKLKNKFIQSNYAGRFYEPNNKEAIKLYGDIAKNGILVLTDAVISDKLPVSKTDTIPKSDNTEITLLGKSGGRINIDNIKNAKKLEITSDKYTIEGFTVYFSGANFPRVKSYQQTGAEFGEAIKSEWENIQPGTAVTFDNILVKNSSGKMIDVQGPGFMIAKN